MLYGMAILFSSREAGMRLGVIGAGRIGKIHGGNIAKRADSVGAYVADVGAAKSLAEATGASVGTVEAILADKTIDARSRSARPPTPTPI